MKPKQQTQGAAPHLYTVEDGWIETYTGKKFFFREAAGQAIDVVDVAHSLSLQCRYNGHTRRFYSVAEHCLLMAWAALREGRTALERLTVLHHDDAEYIISDLPRPIKHGLTGFLDMEKQVETAVARQFGTIYPFPAWLKDMDSRILRDERDQAMSRSGNELGTDSLEPLNVALRFYAPPAAEYHFLEEHRRLTALVAAEARALDAQLDGDAV